MSNTPASDVLQPVAGATRPERKRQALELFAGLPARYDVLSAALSLWQDPRWRRALVEAVAPRDGERILDVATGTGMVAAELLARADCSVVAIDQSPQMLAAARARFARARADTEAVGDTSVADALAPGPRATRVQLVQGEAEALPFADRSFDAVTFTYLLRYVEDPRATLRELARVLRPGGRLASLEFGVPPWPPARLAWRLYTAILLPALGRAVSPEWGRVGRFLGPSIREFYVRHPLEQQLGYWREAGLEEIGARRMSLGGGVVICARRSAGAARASADRGDRAVARRA